MAVVSRRILALACLIMTCIILSWNQDLHQGVSSAPLNQNDEYSTFLKDKQRRRRRRRRWQGGHRSDLCVLEQDFDSTLTPLVVPATDKVNLETCVTMATALSRGWPVAYHNPSVHIPLSPGEDVKSKKNKIQMKFIESSDTDDLLLFVDAYDVVFVRSPEGFASDMEDVLNGLHSLRVVYGAETNCWPFLHPHYQNCPQLGMGFVNGKLRDNYVCQNYPSSPTAYRFLNTGAVVGAAGALKALAVSLPLLRGMIPPGCIIDDQGLMNHAFLYTHGRWGNSQDEQRWKQLNLSSFGPAPHMMFSKPIGLDMHARLFYNLGEGAINDLWYPASLSHPQNNATGSQPYLLHCNGDKSPFQRLSRQALKGSKLDLHGFKFVCDNTNTTMAELCGHFLQENGYLS